MSPGSSWKGVKINTCVISSEILRTTLTNALSEEEVQFYVMQMKAPGNLRASLNLYGFSPQMAEQTKELTRNKLTVPVLAWGGRRSFGDHCFDCAKAIANKAAGGVIEECGHWVFEEKSDFIVAELSQFWSRHA